MVWPVSLSDTVVVVFLCCCCCYCACSKWYDSTYPYHRNRASRGGSRGASQRKEDGTIFGLQEDRNDIIPVLQEHCIDSYPSYAGGMFYLLSRSILNLIARYVAAKRPWLLVATTVGVGGCCYWVMIAATDDRCY